MTCCNSGIPLEGTGLIHFVLCTWMAFGSHVIRWVPTSICFFFLSFLFFLTADKTSTAPPIGVDAERQCQVIFLKHAHVPKSVQCRSLVSKIKFGFDEEQRLLCVFLNRVERVQRWRQKDVVDERHGLIEKRDVNLAVFGCCLFV